MKRKFSLIHIKKLSDSHKGLPNYNKGKKFPDLHHDKQFKKGQIPWNKGKKCPTLSVKRSKMSEQSLINISLGQKKRFDKVGRKERRTSYYLTDKRYKQWRSDVFTRDGWVCQTCKNSVGGKLQAHHIKSWSKFPDSRYDINNGVTLCIDCHKLTDNYGNKKYV